MSATSQGGEAYRRWECAACGKVYVWAVKAHDGTWHWPSHECSPASVAAKEAASTRSEEPVPLADPSRRPVPERLNAGLRMLWGE